MNMKADYIWDLRKREGWRQLEPDECLTVSEVARMMSEAESDQFGLSHHDEITMFIQCWNNTSAEGREAMLDKDPSVSLPNSELTILGAVVHGLCEKDGVEAPEWAVKAKAFTPQTVSGLPIDSVGGQSTKFRSPPVCEQHNIYYESDYLLTV